MVATGSGGALGLSPKSSLRSLEDIFFPSAGPTMLQAEGGGASGLSQPYLLAVTLIHPCVVLACEQNDPTRTSSYHAPLPVRQLFD